ncbi:VTT domain-containing protein [Halolamina salifodinae]|uniref:Putative membrane protein YdjX (TVP38/TMEM64 family) n=1 Tax=Halolamina salifodinae TaxID=1202767 RepID=A0A8T4GTR6_9EURY|nr:VTT domain-containing protein [Halolamina salifodinae]MBP1985790.1 putative membrane protein YdjX (TVP38/TMEM64 family) [Halolamina salifodinae]
MQRRSRAALGAAILLLVAVGAVLTSPRWLLARLDWLAADPVRFVAALVVLALVRPLLAWPTTLIAVVVGYGWGFRGLPVALALIALTSVPPFLLARHSADGGRFATAGAKAVDATGDLRGVIVSRLLPAPSDVVSVGIGLSGVPVRAFLVGTAIGELPWAVAGIVAGRSIDRVLREGLGSVVEPELIVAAAVAAVLLLAGPAYRHFRAESTDLT